MKKKRKQDEDGDEPDNPFEKMIRGYSDERLLEDNQRFEESRVRYILDLTAPKRSKKFIAQVRDREEDMSGDHRLTFRAFDDCFSSFPFKLASTWLDGVQLHKTPSAFVPACFRNFQDVPFVRAFDSYYEQAKPGAGDRGVGLIFPRKGIKHGMVILDTFPDTTSFRGLTWTYHGGTRKHEVCLHVLLLQSLIEAIHNRGHGWSPD